MKTRAKDVREAFAGDPTLARASHRISIRKVLLRHRVCGAVAVLTVAALVPPAAGAGELAATLRSLERVFRSSSASDLRESLASGRRVYLALPVVSDKDGFVGSDQVYYLFQAFFEKNPTRSFSIAKDAVERSGHTAFARAEWRFVAPGGQVHSEPLVFTLAEEEGRWVVTEIRAARS